MSKATEREEFLYKMAQEGVPLDVARKVLRHTASIHRLAEDSCNGVPWNRGITPKHWRIFPSGFGKLACGEEPGEGVKETKQFALVSCPDCKSVRHEERIRQMLAPFKIEATFQGDPRGAACILKVPSGATDDWGRRGLCVPA